MTTQVRKRIFLFLAVIVLTMLACNLGATQNIETQAPEIAPPSPQIDQPEITDQGICFNPLYPVKSGATWTYASTGAFTGDYSFTDTITSVREAGFTLTAQFDQLTRTQEWNCKTEGLASLTFGGGPAAGINASGVQMDLTTSNIQGINIPKTIAAGDQWSYSLDFEGRMDFTGTSADVQGTATYTFNALGEESITVPAGTFNTMKIQSAMDLQMQITFSDIVTPTEFVSTSDMWFAPNVGWIKAVSSGDFMGEPVNETIELQSYSIP